jgi:hypothetical protein
MDAPSDEVRRWDHEARAYEPVVAVDWGTRRMIKGERCP